MFFLCLFFHCHRVSDWDTRGIQPWMTHVGGSRAVLVEVIKVHSKSYITIAKYCISHVLLFNCHIDRNQNLQLDSNEYLSPEVLLICMYMRATLREVAACTFICLEPFTRLACANGIAHGRDLQRTCPELMQMAHNCTVKCLWRWRMTHAKGHGILRLQSRSNTGRTTFHY